MSSSWSDYVFFIFSVHNRINISTYVSCYNHRKHNSSGEKNNSFDCYLESIPSQKTAARICLTLRLFHLLKKFIKLVTSNVLNAALLMSFEKLCKKIVSTFYT